MLRGSGAERSMGNKAVFPMSSPRIQANPQSSLPFGEEAKPRFRTKTVATRLTPDELAEMVLAELWAVRYTLLNLFHAAAQAAAEGRPLLPDSILKIRDQSDARKRQH